MKGFKKFLIYFFIVLGILIAIVLSIFAFMYFSPGTPVLGFEYVSYQKTETQTFNYSSDPSIQNIRSFEVESDNCDIFIYPNDQSDEIKIVQVQDFKGFAKVDNANLKVEKKIVTKQYEEISSGSNLKTFVVDFGEPTGWISKNKSKIEIYIANSLNLDTIHVKTMGGNIYYNSTLDENNISCDNLFLLCGGNGNVDIKNNQNISNYFLTTQNGSVKFNDLTSINANQIKFKTDKGSFVVSNQNKNSVLNANLNIVSNDIKNGPYVYVNKLNGHLNVNSNSGTYVFDEIGSYSNYKKVLINSNNSAINIGTAYANVSILSSNIKKNDITINNLYGQTNTFETGAGACVINNLEGDIAIESTSGNVNLKKVNPTNDVYICSNSGNINVNYVYSDENNKNNFLKVVTNTGNINLDNVSCLLQIKALSSSKNSSCNIGFASVSADNSKDNTIEIKDRQANLYFINSGSFTRCRIVTKANVNIIGTAIGSDISTEYDINNVKNTDYILDEYEGYSISYRINYNKDDETYVHANFNQMGRIIIDSSNQTNIYSKIV